MDLVGDPGATYVVERSTNLVDWVTLMTTNIPPSGLIEYVDQFVDLSAPPASAFYRVAQP